jgi:hypothetical protein
MAHQKPLTLSKTFNNFLDEMTKQYNLTRDEILRAYNVFGEFKGKIWTYCIQCTYLRKKGLPVEEKHLFRMVNRWFPS